MSDAIGSLQDAQGESLDGLLTENLSEAGASNNPFALSEDHEFKVPEHVDRSVDSDAEKIPVVEHVSSEPIPAAPGTPESSFRKCPCIGVMPGRACPRCNCSKWVKTCPKCHGEMTLTVQNRKGSHPRTERCGYCMGLGQVAARITEVAAAREAAEAYKPNVAQEKQVVLRGAQLPGLRGVRAKTFAERAAKKSVKLRASRG